MYQRGLLRPVAAPAAVRLQPSAHSRASRSDHGRNFQVRNPSAAQAVQQQYHSVGLKAEMGAPQGESVLLRGQFGPSVAGHAAEQVRQEVSAFLVQTRRGEAASDGLRILAGDAAASHSRLRRPLWIRGKN